MIFQEEQIFRKSLAFTLQELNILIHLRTDSDPKQEEKYNKAKDKYEKKLQKAIDNAVETKTIPEGS
jgi:hypothetical protein